MLELLGQLEERSQFFNLFNYITFRTGGAMFTAMIIAFAIGAPFIAWLRKKQGKGQPIREDGPQGHLLTKKGTPTMGGLIILISLGIASLLWADLKNPYVWAVLLVTAAFGTIGFVDDFAKVTKQHHGGLSAKVRLAAEFSAALLSALIMLVAEWVATTPDQAHDAMGFFNALMAGDPLTAVALPFVTGWGIQLFAFYIVFAMIVIVGFGNAVNLTGRLDGFFKNAAIKILLPKQLETVGKGLRAVGQGKMVDEFVLSMNRAAEKAAPQARKFFVDAIKEMTFDDARKILTGGDTAATEYFKEKTADKIATAFRPIIETAMNDVGATRQYKELTGRVRNLPFVRTESLDIDDYVVNKSLDGLFYMVGEEEKKIRKNPAARVTSILREVFGRRR